MPHSGTITSIADTAVNKAATPSRAASSKRTIFADVVLRDVVQETVGVGIKCGRRRVMTGAVSDGNERASNGYDGVAG